MHGSCRQNEDGGHVNAFPTAMIRLGPHIRLTRPEIEYFLWLTDIEPAGIRTLADLDAYVARCKAYYWGVSRETRRLHALIDQARARCERQA